MKSFKQLFVEAIVNATIEEYYVALENAYKDKFSTEEDFQKFMKFIKENDLQMSDHFGIDLKVEKEDNGTLLLMYGENSTDVMLYGIVSTKGKMNRNDLSAINLWIDKLIKKMKEGKKFTTSPHELSARLLKHIKEKISKDPNYTLTRKVLNAVNLSDYGFNLKDDRFNKYENITLSLKKK